MAMNAYGNAFNTYKSNSINFASKDQLLLMLVDGAAKFSKIGRQAILDKDIKKAHENIVKNSKYILRINGNIRCVKRWTMGRKINEGLRFYNSKTYRG